jgi:hypothetical protein
MIARVYPVLPPAAAAIARIDTHLGYPQQHTQPDGRITATLTYALPEELAAGGFAVFVKRNIDTSAGVATGTRRDVARTEVKSEVNAPVTPSVAKEVTK